MALDFIAIIVVIVVVVSSVPDQRRRQKRIVKVQPYRRQTDIHTTPIVPNPLLSYLYLKIDFGQQQNIAYTDI